MSATPPADNPPPATQNAARGNRNNRDQRNRGTQRRTVNTNVFKGTIKEMNGHVFQCHGESNEKNQFARTVEELSNYVGLHFKHNPDDIKKMIQNMADTVLTPPNDPAANASQTLTLIWSKEVDLYVKKKDTYKTNKCALYSVVWGQCSTNMQA
jgi:hypothetical protein